MLVEGGGIKGPAILATIAGSVFAGLLQAIGPTPSPVTVVTGVLSGISVFLFTMFIRQGNKLAALEAYSKRNKDDIDKLDGESRTVDKRIEQSRHAWKNEILPQILSVEERAIFNVDQLRERVATNEDRLNRYLDEQLRQLRQGA